MRRTFLPFLGALLFCAACTGGAGGVGGPSFTNGDEVSVPLVTTQEELKLLRQREEIVRMNFDALSSEEATLERERQAIERALVSLKMEEKSSRTYAHQAALQQRLLQLDDAKQELRRARIMLTTLTADREKYEDFLLQTYRQMAEEYRASTEGTVLPSAFALRWPVDPERGLSAVFQDAGYRKRFGIPHNAIDIPVAQGTQIHAPADGTVLAVNDRGYGYSTVVLQHAGGMVTVYGHVSGFLVAKGDRVQAGDAIALTGGRPGSKGAGPLTTGPHLHFEVHVHGEAVNPVEYLPAL